MLDYVTEKEFDPAIHTRFSDLKMMMKVRIKGQTRKEKTGRVIGLERWTPPDKFDPKNHGEITIGPAPRMLVYNPMKL